MEKRPTVYIVANPTRTVLYIGVTSNLAQRCSQHKLKLINGFSKRYHCTDLVYYELYDDMNTAIAREKQIKHWKRVWKLQLIQKQNPKMGDLYQEIV